MEQLSLFENKVLLSIYVIVPLDNKLGSIGRLMECVCFYLERHLWLFIGRKSCELCPLVLLL